jgi:hypothetical protein
MLRRALLIAGFMVLPTLAHAQTALSPWVQQVLERADNGVSTADGRPATSVCDNNTKAAEFEINLSFARERTSAVVGLEAEAWQLRERTVCYESDRKLILNKLNELLEKIDQAVADCKFESAGVLRSTYDFLLGAYESFLKGGANPAYEDDRLRKIYPFQDDGSWENLDGPQTDTGSTAPLCAFTSDYAPHVIGYIPARPGEAVTSFDMKSYGCDIDALGSVGSPLDAEAQNFRTFLIETDDFARSVYNTVSMALTSINTILSIYSGEPPDSGPVIAQPAPPHDTVSGCLKPYVPDPSSALPQEWEDLLVAYPEYFDLWRSRIDADGNIIFDPEPGEVLPAGFLFEPALDFFRMDPPAFTRLRQYIDRRGDVGYFRPLPLDMTTVTLDSYLSVLQQSNSQNDMRFISVNNEQFIAYEEAVSRDAYQRMKAASAPLNEAVQKLVMVTEEFLPEEYVPELTYFLARSCVDGHCQTTLDNVTKRIFNPYCTPYLSGLYTEEDAHKKCFCDPEMDGVWGDYDKYCDSDFSSEQSRYDGMQPTLFPGCVEDGFEMSSSAP